MHQDILIHPLTTLRFDRRSYCLESQDMKLPWIEINIQAVLANFRAITFVNCPGKHICHTPHSVIKNRCRKPDPSLRGSFRQVDDDEVAHRLMDNAPGHEVEMARVIGPSGEFAELPLPAPEVVTANDAKKLLIKFREVSVS